MTKFVLLLATVIMTIGLATSGHADPLVLKYGWFGPPTEPTYVKSMKPFAEAISADSAGTITVEMYPGGTLGKDPSGQIKYVQDGVLDISYIIPSYTPGRFPDNPLFEMPSLFHSATEASLAMWRVQARGLLRGYEELHVLQLAVTHPNLIHTSKPVATLGDLKGLKVRVSGPLAAETMRVLGAVPVGMPVTQAAEAVTRGVVDGTMQDWNTYAAFRLTDAAKHHFGVRLGQAPMLVAMTKERYKELPGAARAALDKHAYKKLSREVGALHDAITEDWRGKVGTLADHRMVDPDPADLAEIERRTRPIIVDWAKQNPNGAELLAAVETELERIRRER